MHSKRTYGGISIGHERRSEADSFQKSGKLPGWVCPSAAHADGSAVIVFAVLLNPPWGLPFQFFSSIFPIAGSKQERIREVGQGRAFCARRASGRSEAESLDQPPALRTIVPGKIGELPFSRLGLGRFQRVFVRL